MKALSDYVKEAIDTLKNGPCNFWACTYFETEKFGIRKKHIPMVTCSRCQAIIKLNNGLIKNTD